MAEERQGMVNFKHDVEKFKKIVREKYRYTDRESTTKEESHILIGVMDVGKYISEMDVHLKTKIVTVAKELGTVVQTAE